MLEKLNQQQFFVGLQTSGEENNIVPPYQVSPYPAEGRPDIGEETASEEQETTIMEPYCSRPPAEGREDIASDVQQEEQQAYSKQHPPTPHQARKPQGEA
ncbi:hypothetical protein EI42_04472 [Thermosporothrix hazakensis]|jgi:hypothetical protein|uniref:Uncharacterized protein n=1 Tax=Thermosporothrix hazakensis TaxID=644383 RepID=A0A326U2Z4_THEHA|nr:hypothetical protein [Thermosporothrix hazakensis]PZW24864.1 hypothetical protein EI42_04472 [Thermosporothrix hazakensis]GCE46447.1 hypothetical protein KTH_13160 [Thermosporothrix hazakensis]